VTPPSGIGDRSRHPDQMSPRVAIHRRQDQPPQTFSYAILCFRMRRPEVAGTLPQISDPTEYGA
jgi:hypothetical protein